MALFFLPLLVPLCCGTVTCVTDLCSRVSGFQVLELQLSGVRGEEREREGGVWGSCV